MSNKRQSGYAIKIKGFLPAGETIQDHQASSAAMIKAIDSGDYSGLLKQLKAVEVDYAFTSKSMPEPTLSAAPVIPDKK